MADPRDWKPSSRFIGIKLNAGHDRNGNPRRGWAIIDMSTGDAVDFVDEGYRGRGALESAYPGAIVGPEFPTTPATYRDLKRAAER